MLTPFPDLLYPFFAPTLLRAMLALVFFYVAYSQYKLRGAIAPVAPLGMGIAFVWLAATFHIAVGAALLVGYYVQIAAIAAAVGLAKGWWYNRQYPNIVILPNSTVLVLIVVAVSLVISGAGALAQDLPL